MGDSVSFSTLMSLCGARIDDERVDEMKAHVGADVQRHIEKDRFRICATKYLRNISKRISTSICAAVSLSTTVIGRVDSSDKPKTTRLERFPSNE